MSNKYHDQLVNIIDPDKPQPTVFELLELMRGEVEQALTLLGIVQPPSQSARAVLAMAALEAKLDGLKGMPFDAAYKQRRVLNSSLRLLQDFLAVHRACWILQGRAL